MLKTLCEGHLVSLAEGARNGAVLLSGPIRLWDGCAWVAPFREFPPPTVWVAKE